MALNIKDPETDRLARELAATTGESITTAVSVALQERLRRVRPADPDLMADLNAIADRAAARPVLSYEDPIPYDEHGLPI